MSLTLLAALTKLPQTPDPTDPDGVMVFIFSSSFIEELLRFLDQDL